MQTFGEAKRRSLVKAVGLTEAVTCHLRSLRVKMQRHNCSGKSVIMLIYDYSKKTAPHRRGESLRGEVQNERDLEQHQRLFEY